MNHLWVTSLCPVIIWGMLVIFFLSICFAVQDGVARLKRMHQVPCSRCVFFTGNYHLKCTVHPCRALSEEAIGCLDFEPAPAPQPIGLLLQEYRNNASLPFRKSSAFVD